MTHPVPPGPIVHGGQNRHRTGSFIQQRMMNMKTIVLVTGDASVCSLNNKNM